MTTYHFIERETRAGAPLLFTFHGTGGDENQFFELARSMLPAAHIISLRGNVSEHGALRFFKRTGEGVYDMADLAVRTQSMIEFVDAQRERTKASRVIGLGYSNGANILASVLFQKPELFSNAVLMHPLIPWTPADQPGLKDKRLLITAGKRDPICPAPQSEKLVQYFEHQGAETKLLWHDGGHELRQTEIEAVGAFLS